MKALSIHQPWASLIIAGIKPVENRTWATKYRGELAIHASMKYDTEGAEWLRSIGVDPPGPDACPRGAILGTVDLLDCVPIAALPAAGRFATGPICWLLADPRPLPEPIPCKGKQGLWNWSNCPPPADRVE